MLTKAIRDKLTDRLCTLPARENEMFESSEFARQKVRLEIGRALEKWTGSDEHAKILVQSLIDTSKFRPTPAEINERSQQTPAHVDLPDSCDICQGGLYITVQKTLIDTYTRQPMLREGSQRCTCSRGQ